MQAHRRELYARFPPPSSRGAPILWALPPPANHLQVRSSLHEIAATRGAPLRHAHLSTDAHVHAGPGNLRRGHPACAGDPPLQSRNPYPAVAGRLPRRHSFAWLDSSNPRTAPSLRTRFCRIQRNDCDHRADGEIRIRRGRCRCGRGQRPGGGRLRRREPSPRAQSGARPPDRIRQGHVAGRRAHGRLAGRRATHWIADPPVGPCRLKPVTQSKQPESSKLKS